MAANSVPGVTGWLSIDSVDRTRLLGRVAFLIIILTFLLIAAFTIANAFSWLNKPFPGFLFNARMVVADYGQYHWPGVQAGLKFPAKLISANGQKVNRGADLDQVLQGSGVGTKVTYLFVENGRSFQLALPTIRFSVWDLVMTFGVECVVALLYFGLGVVVFIMKPDTELSWIFFLACFWLGIYVISGFDIVSSHKSLLPYNMATAFLPASFAHMSLVFPHRWAFTRRHISLLYIPYLISAAAFVPFHAYYPGPVFLAIYPFLYAYFFLSAMSPAVSGIVAYLEGTSRIAKQRAKVILFGAIVAFPLPALMYVVPLIGGSWGDFKFNANFLVLAGFVYPACIAYAIAKHNLFDVDVYIKRAVGYAIMTAVVGSGYFFIQTVTTTFVFRPLFGEYADRVYPLVFALLVVFLFNPINRKVQETVDRIFFRKKFDYKETVRTVSNALTSLLNLDEILKQVVHTIRTQMFIDTAGVIVVEKKAYQAFFVGDAPGKNGDETRDVRIASDDPLLSLLSSKKSLITRYDIEEDPSYQDAKEVYRESFDKIEASLVLPLVYKGEMTGAVALGNKKSGHFYSREDIELLTTMADQAAVAIENAQLAEQMKKEETVRTNLARYLSPQIVDQIVRHDVQVNLGGDKKVVTVLFSDIRNFTGITETQPPDKLVRLLNEYFTEMAGIIFQNQGSLDKYIGDAIVAVFGSLINLENSAQNAARAAVQMMKRIPELNQRWTREYGFKMQIGIGLNTGEVFLGNIGSPERMEFTVIGDTVNVASRFSGLAKPGQILITRETVNCLDSEIEYRELPPAEVKGKTGKLEVFEMLWI